MVVPQLSTPLSESRTIPRRWNLLLIMLVIGFSQISTFGQASAPLSSTYIAGHVYRSDTNGPIPHATVTVTGIVSGVPFAESPTMVTGADGAYHFDGLPPGFYTVIASADPFFASAHTNGIDLRTGKSADSVDVKLDPTGIVSGVVTDKDGEPVQGVFVKALYPGIPPKPVGFSAPPTDDQGAFRIGEIKPSECLLAVGFDSIPGRSGIPPVYYPGTTDLTLASTVLIKAGSETSGVRIVLPDLGATPDAGNSIDSPAGSIAGTVTRADNSAPIPKALVTLRLNSPVFFAPRFAWTGPKGDYQFAGLQPGNYAVSIQASGYMGPFTGIMTQSAIVGTEPVANIDARLNPAGVIAGTVRDPEGSPLFLANVSIIRKDGARQVQVGTATTDILGTFRALAPTPGQYFLRISTQPFGPQAQLGYASVFYPNAKTLDGAQAIEIAPGSTLPEFQITLAKISTFDLTMKIKNFSGDPHIVYMFSVKQQGPIRPSIPGPITASVSRSQFAEAGSTVRFRSVPEGSYTASITSAVVTRDSSGRIVHASSQGPPVGTADVQISGANASVEVEIQTDAGHNPQ